MLTVFAYTDRRAALQSASSCTLLNSSPGVCYVRFAHIYASPAGVGLFNGTRSSSFPGVSYAHYVRINGSPCGTKNDTQVSFS